MTKKNNNVHVMPDPETWAMLDPEIRTNMLRYEKAFRKVLTGQLEDKSGLKVKIGTGFTMSDQTDEEYQRQTRSDGCDRLYIRFDIDDPLGAFDGLGLVRAENDKAILYGQCALWMPVGTGRPSIVFHHEGYSGHFIYVPGRPLVRVNSLPSGDITPGLERAKRKVATLVASKRLRKFKVHRSIVRIDETKAD